MSLATVFVSLPFVVREVAPVLIEIGDEQEQAAATLGADVRVVTIRAGHAGRWLEHELEREGIPAESIWVDGESRSSLSVADRAAAGLTEFYEHGVAVTESAWRRFAGRLSALSRTAAWVTISGSLPPGDRRNRMQPRESPVIQINTETEEVLLGGPTELAYRRPDSNARNDRYRLWEVPGASHISNDLGSSPITEERDLAEIERVPLSALPPTGCAHQQYQSGPWVGVDGVVDPNPYPFGYVADAAFADLTKWLDDGTPPPRAARIQVTDTRAATTDRDRFGNALGGLRTPFVDVPTATYSPIDGSAHETNLSGLCPLIGFSIPFSQATLHALYPSHADYLARVTPETNELVHKGFWVGSDAANVVRQAAASDVP